MWRVLLLVAMIQPPPSACPDVEACRADAEAAAARGEYEAFHDLAWRAVQKGRPHDAQLMYLLARAQARTGRPGDALVMLGRLADLRASVDVMTDDFVQVRLLKDWPSLAARLLGVVAGAAADAPAASR